MIKNKVRWAFRIGTGDELMVSEKKSVKKGDVLAKLKSEKTEGSATLELKCPVDATVLKVTDKVVLEFKADRFKGIGVGGGKRWGKGIKVLTDRGNLTYEDRNKIILDRTGQLVTALKAKAIGAIGLVITSDKIGSYLPTIKVENDEFEKLVKMASENVDVWFNGDSGRIFVV